MALMVFDGGGGEGRRGWSLFQLTAAEGSATGPITLNRGASKSIDMATRGQRRSEKPLLRCGNESVIKSRDVGGEAEHLSKHQYGAAQRHWRGQRRREARKERERLHSHHQL
jgi:hypothetical protein